MSRIYYSEEEDVPGTFALHRANTWRSIKGRKGQKALGELLAALDSMPEKRLVPHRIADRDGGVCAVGALVVAKLAQEKAWRWPDAVAEVHERWDPDSCVECWHVEKAHPDGGACTLCKGKPWPGKTACERFELEGPEDDPGHTESVGREYGLPHLVAWRLVELNDMVLDRETPEQRWAAVHKWVERALREGSTDPDAPYGWL